MFDLQPDKLSPNEMRQAFDFYDTVLNSMVEGLYTVDINGLVVSMNPAAERLLGWKLGELRGKKMHEITHYKHRDGTAFPADECAGLSVLRDGNVIEGHEDVFIRKDGTFFDVIYSSSPLHEDNRITGLLVVFQDVTERNLNKGFLDRYRLLSEQTSDVIWFVRPDGTFVDVNRAAVETYGYTRDEFLTMSIHDLRHSSTLEELPKDIDLANSAGAHFETLHVRKDGTVFPVDVNANGADFGGERLIMAIVRDISERKQADDALRKSEELFSKFMQHLPGLAWIKDQNGRYVYANDAAEMAFGVPLEELYGQTDDQVFLPEIAAAFRENDQRVLLEATGSQMVEALEQPDGVLHHSIVSKFPISDRDGNVELIGGMAIDITDRMQAEEALRESEERRQLAQEAGNVGIFDWDIVAGKTYWSETMWSLYGEDVMDIDPDETFWSSHLHPSDSERVKLNIRRAVRSKEGRFNDEFRIVRNDGTVRWVEAKAKILRDDSGKAFRMYGVNLDITARKDSEERTRPSENQLRLVTNAIPALISYVDSSERYRFVNHKFTEWFAVPTEAIVGKTVKDVFGMQAYRTLKPKINEALSGEQCTFETLLTYRNAGTRYVHISYMPDIGVDGIVYGYYGLTHDLTDLKRSQDLLRSSEERLGLMMESMTDYAIFSVDKDGLIDSWNRGAEIIFGYAPSEILGKSSETIFTPEDIQSGIPLREMKNARQKGRASDERWHLRKDGTRFFASGVMMPLYVGKELTGYAKVANDLTEKKRRAEELQEAHDELERRVNERTKELAFSNLALLKQIEEREIAEKQRIDLLHRLVDSQEFERRRIARDLHDQMGQRLTALRLKIASLKDVVTGNDKAISRVERLQVIAEQLDSEVSFLAWELRPTALDDLGLIDAVGAFVSEWSRHYDIAADFHSGGLSKERLNHETETHLYRISQEALNNIAKHADANFVTVLLEKRDDDLILIIEDDGSGFDPASTRNPGKSGKGLGLVGMKERASLVGGDIEIESARGKGTTIFVRVPIST